MNLNSFTKEIKEDICNAYSDLSIEALIPLLSAFIRTLGTLSFRNKNEFLTLEIENSKVIKFIYRAIKEVLPDIEIHFSFRKGMKLNKSTKYIIEITNPNELLKLLYINYLDNKINTSLTNKERKIKTYLSGLFLASGSCNNPKSSNYHLELSLKDNDFSLAILKVIKKIKGKNFEFKEIKRRNNYILYLKRSDQISEFLSFIEANESCLKFERMRLERDFNNVTNRLVNCDVYNYNKTISNSKKQLSYIEFIENKIGLESLSNEKIKLLCLLRKEYPEYNYNELALEMSKKLSVNISKSNINHLFRKIKELALKLNYEEN